MGSTMLHTQMAAMPTASRRPKSRIIGTAAKRNARNANTASKVTEALEDLVGLALQIVGQLLMLLVNLLPHFAEAAGELIVDLAGLLLEVPWREFIELAGEVFRGAGPIVLLGFQTLVKRFNFFGQELLDRREPLLDVLAKIVGFFHQPILRGARICDRSHASERRRADRGPSRPAPPSASAVRVCALMFCGSTVVVTAVCLVG